jgi:hypothetical protein
MEPAIRSGRWPVQRLERIMADQETHLDKDQARAGATPGVARYVLSISLAAIVIIFAILLILYH